MANIRIRNGIVEHSRITQKTASLGYSAPAERSLNAIDRGVAHHLVTGLIVVTLIMLNNIWRGNGWNRPGYHFIIFKSGKIWQIGRIDRPMWGAGASANPRSIHYGFAGTFTSSSLPSRKAQESYAWLHDQFKRIPDLPNYRNDNQMTGHRDWMATACPGFTNAQFRGWITNSQPTTTTPVPTPTPPANNANNALRVGDTVRIRQGARWLDGVRPLIPTFVTNRANRVKSITGNRVVVTYGGIVVGAVNRADIIGQAAAAPNPQPTPTPAAVRVGSRVRVNQSARTWATGQNIPTWVRGQAYNVIQMRNNNREALLAGVKSWIRVSDVTVM